MAETEFIDFWWAVLGSNQRPLPCEGVLKSLNHAVFGNFCYTLGQFGDS
ncbi:MAG: hypothetical protein ACK4Q4_02345 [Rhodocyclaceae bacterium]